jgi:hypothetical protein
VEAESGAVIRAQAPASRSALVAWILMSHDPAVPDNLDYEWLGWLVEHPEKWTEEDLAGARFMLANQKSAVEAMHPKDPNGRGGRGSGSRRPARSGDPEVRRTAPLARLGYGAGRRLREAVEAGRSPRRMGRAPRRSD